MKLIIWVHPTSAPPSPHTILSYSSWGVSCFQNIYNNNNSKKNNNNNNQMRARDRVIGFGKYKGKMLGTLSSEYLRWMSKNLNTDNFKKWGKLAEDVLQDEVYADKMEWEVAEKLLSGNHGGAGVGVAGELEELSKRFGWDYNDKVGWSKVDFRLLGTSMGGRLPRIRVPDQYYKELEMKDKKISVCGLGCAGIERRRRRDRGANKREQHQIIDVRGKKETEEEMNNNNNNTERNNDADENPEMGRRRKFPGRQSLINRVRVHGRVD